MRQYTVLLMPVCSVPAFRHGEREWNIGAQTVAYLDAMRYTQWFNLLGGPAAVILVGRSPEDLPIWDSDCRQTISGRTRARNCCRSGEGLRLSPTAPGDLGLGSTSA